MKRSLFAVMAFAILVLAQHLGSAPAAARAAGSGVASYYCCSFAGRPTASGEIFRPGAMTAAHRSLPFGTLVRVTSVSTGRSVVVRINDRGPFVGGRIIDLSKGAAFAIGIHGVGRVRLEIVGHSGGRTLVAKRHRSKATRYASRHKHAKTRVAMRSAKHAKVRVASRSKSKRVTYAALAKKKQLAKHKRKGASTKVASRSGKTWKVASKSKSWKSASKGKSWKVASKSKKWKVASHKRKGGYKLPGDAKAAAAVAPPPSN